MKFLKSLPIMDVTVSPRKSFENTVGYKLYRIIPKVQLFLKVFKGIK